jgi:hypothetical protein
MWHAMLCVCVLGVCVCVCVHAGDKLFSICSHSHASRCPGAFFPLLTHLICSLRSSNRTYILQFQGSVRAAGRAAERAQQPATREDCVDGMGECTGSMYENVFSVGMIKEE